MKVGLVGKKCGMTRLFETNGSSIPVSVVYVEPCEVLENQTIEKNGYRALKIACGGFAKKNKVSQPLQGIYKKSSVSLRELIKEFRLSDTDEEYAVGDKLSVALFSDVKFVDVQGISKGKGFSGVIKRHNFRTQDATHGNSLSHRAPGSIGQNQTPGRVF